MVGRAGVALSLMAALSATASGCGWERLYADPQSGPASANLRAIKVLPIPERMGQRMELALREALNPTGEPTPVRYTLRTALLFSLSSLGIQTQGTATLGKIDATATCFLVANASGQNLTTFTVHDQNSFILNPNQYSTVVAEDDAQRRTAAELSQEIMLQLSLFMDRHAAQKPAKAG
jgi:LPS-assembly lipoprotein